MNSNDFYKIHYVLTFKHKVKVPISQNFFHSFPWKTRLKHKTTKENVFQYVIFLFCQYFSLLHFTNSWARIQKNNYTLFLFSMHVIIILFLIFSFHLFSLFFYHFLPFFLRKKDKFVIKILTRFFSLFFFIVSFNFLII